VTDCPTSLPIALLDIGSDCTVTVYGNVYGNTNVSNTASVVVDSGSSGTGPYASVPWLPNRFPLVASVSEFKIIEPFEPIPNSHTTQIHPETTKHMANPSTTEIRKSITRRQR
jgi:hypothetical protein